MNIKSLYSDAQAIRRLGCSDAIKVRMLTALMSQDQNAWRVIGITTDALAKFAAHNFKRVSGMGVNRAHIVDRHKTYKEMLSRDMAVDEWWAFIQERDKCLLATASENMSGAYSDVIPIDPALGLFKSQGYAWKHNTAETTFLSNLHKAKANGR